MNSALAIKNFLPEQYEKTGKLPINHNYLQQQFADYEAIFDKLKKVVVDGDFTLGEAVNQFEDEFKEIDENKRINLSIKQADPNFAKNKAPGAEGAPRQNRPARFDHRQRR